ncbi:hypothetical protein [Nocardia sp. NBC_01329]|uniref:hypothetical protein n=1 Tax=Nocardia sp. NBC_01329 TaxID=2903594 RepID=UPI002E13AFB3|nr:hypothetical protein OG405_09165 [Nocardia sp. NBC_01329]
MPGSIVHDSEAAAGFADAAALVAELLGAAAGHVDTAAGAPLGGLGVFGADFADAFAAAVQTQAATIRTAAALFGAYGQTVTEQGAALAAIDAGTAAALAGVADVEGA